MLEEPRLDDLSDLTLPACLSDMLSLHVDWIYPAQLIGKKGPA